MVTLYLILLKKITTIRLYGDTSSESINMLLADSTSPSVPIGAGLPKKLMQQIKAGEFVDFCDLPPYMGSVFSVLQFHCSTGNRPATLATL